MTSETSKSRNLFDKNRKQEIQFKEDESQTGVFSSFVDDVLISLNSCDDNSTQYRYTPPPPPLIRDEVDILLCDMEMPSTSTNSAKPLNREVERTDRRHANEYSNHYSDWDTKRCPPNIQSQSPVYDDSAYQHRNATSPRTSTSRSFHSSSPADDNYVSDAYNPHYRPPRHNRNRRPSPYSPPQRHTYTFCELLAYSMSPAARAIANGFSPDALEVLQTDSCKKPTFPPHFECKAYPLNTPGVCNKVVRNSRLSKDDLSNGLYIIPPHRSGVFYNAEEFMNLFLDAHNRWARLISVKEYCLRKKLIKQMQMEERRVNSSMNGWY